MNIKNIVQMANDINRRDTMSRQYAFSGSGSTRPMTDDFHKDPSLTGLMLAGSDSLSWAVNASAGGYSVITLKCVYMSCNYYFYWTGTYAYTGQLRDFFKSIGIDEGK